MANEIVKYNNWLNNLTLTNFNAAELDLLMSICAKLKERGEEELTFTFREIRELSNYWSTSNMQLAKDLDSTNDKLGHVTCRIETERFIIKFVLFTTFIIDKEEHLLNISVNPKFSFVLNALTNNFTRFELSEFVTLDGKYPKRLYMLLKQFRSTGKMHVSLEDFRRRMDIPKSYKNRDVMEKVIKPSIKELEKNFPRLSVSTQKAHRRGAPVTGYVFTFSKEVTVESKEIPAKGKKKNTLSKAARNPKIHNFEEREYTDRQKELMEKIFCGYATEDEKNEYGRLINNR